MFANRFTVVLDACVLVPVLKRNLLLSLAEVELFRVAWTGRILDEAEVAICELLHQRGRPEPQVGARASRLAIEAAFPEAMVAGWESLATSLRGIPDQDDAHVIAAALCVRAGQIVTDNLRDFPPELMRAVGLEVRSADEFIADALDLPNDHESGLAAVARMRMRLQRPELSADDLLASMERNGLMLTAAILARHKDRF